MDFRSDRLATLYFFSLFRRLTFGKAGLPILMYHSIREGTEARHAYFETNTSPAVFARQMRWLHDNGYQTPSWEAVGKLLAGRGSIDIPKPVVITFDDGYADFHREAFPILTQYGFSATVFVVSGLLKVQHAVFKGMECLNLAEVRELHAHGITIGSHTVSHPELKRLSVEAVEGELAGSKKSLEDSLGAPVTTFAYPYAFPETNRPFVRTLAGLMERCGYAHGVTTILGTARRGAPRWFLPRLPVNTWDDPALFRAKLEGAYDWLRGPQRTAKSLKNFLHRGAPLNKLALQTSSGASH